MSRVLRGLAAALAVGAVVAGIAPVSAADLDVVYPPPPPPPLEAPPPTGYEYMLHGFLHKIIPVRAAPIRSSQVLYGLSSGVIPNLTGRCTRNLDLASIAERSTWYRRAAVVTRWCEVVGLNPTASTGWIDGGYIRPF